MNMVTKLDYSVGDYNTMSVLDKLLMVDYWTEYDNLTAGCDFQTWFVNFATTPELIRRARQWLSTHNYLILKQDVVERAMQADGNFARSIKG